MGAQGRKPARGPLPDVAPDLSGSVDPSLIRRGMPKSKAYELKYSDLSFGHPEIGWASREDCRDEDEEDRRLADVMAKQGIRGRVAEGKAWVDHMPTPEEMGDEELMYRLEACDPDAEHDDLTEPNGPLADYWREAERRGILELG